MEHQKHTAIFASIVIFILLIGFNITEAQAYVLLAPLPGISAGQAVSLSDYLDTVFKVGIGLAGVFAVLMIVIGGVQYIGGAASPSARTEAKSKITNAILGLLLALGAWLILYTINPDLLKKGGINIIPQISITPPTTISTPAQPTEYCYSQTYGRSKNTRTTCGNTCPQGKTCTIK